MTKIVRCPTEWGIETAIVGPILQIAKLERSLSRSFTPTVLMHEVHATYAGVNVGILCTTLGQPIPALHNLWCSLFGLRGIANE